MKTSTNTVGQTYNEIVNSPIGSKVYYFYQEELSSYEHLFAQGADGGVVAGSTLPPALNEFARVLAVKWLCENIDVEEAITKYADILSEGKNYLWLHLIQTWELRLESKYPHYQDIFEDWEHYLEEA